MSRIDSIVHGVLYHYGLQFSYEWANDYWVTYNATFIAFSIILGLMYWLGSNKTAKNLKFSFGLAVTVILLLIGGLQDIMFFVFWDGGLPPNDVIWWWAPGHYLFGTWTSLMQLAFSIATLSIITLLWVRILGKSIFHSSQSVS